MGVNEVHVKILLLLCRLGLVLRLGSDLVWLLSGNNLVVLSIAIWFMKQKIAMQTANSLGMHQPVFIRVGFATA